MNTLKAFIKAFEAPQRSVKITIYVNFFSPSGIGTGRVNFILASCLILLFIRASWGTKKEAKTNYTLNFWNRWVWKSRMIYYRMQENQPSEVTN